MTDTLVEEKDAAPHGRDPDTGEALTPYGLNRNGTPRKGNRGAKPGPRANRPRTGRRAAPKVKSGSQTDARRKDALIGLADMLIVTPLATVSASPQLAGRFGDKQTDAFAGDAVLVSRFMPDIADGLILLSQSKPGALAWLDQVEEKAPYLFLANVGVQLAKAVAENHLRPNPRLAEAGRLMVAMRVQQMAEAIEAEARAMGVEMPQTSQNGAEPTVPIPQPT